MQKPYTDIFYLSYTGIIQTKKFHNATNKGKLAKSKTVIKDSPRIDGILESHSANRIAEAKKKIQKTYKLNKSKVRGRAIAFSRLPKSRKNFFFYTISFPSQLPDNQCFEIFNICLTRLRKAEMLKDYLWITERQKNSTLHFHILTNDLFSVQKMNAFVRKSLINKVLQKKFEYNIEVLKKYNGVDIAKSWKTKKVMNFGRESCKSLIINYLTKYITKNDISFYRLPFHSSHSISKLKKSVQISDYEALMIFSEFDSKNITPKTIRNDWYTWFGFSNDVKEEAFEIIDMYNELIYSNLPLPTKTAPIFIDNPQKPVKRKIQLALF